MTIFSMPRRGFCIATLLASFAFAPLAALALDINTASSEELQTLKGIGPKRAEAIVRYRDEHGPFASVEALTSVPGVGPSILEDNASELESSPAGNDK